MNRFSIRDIENLTGIKAHTLRIWEQRYGVIVPKRKSSKHRFYDNEDLKHVLRIAHLYHKGYKISKIAKFEGRELKHVAEEEKNDMPFSFVNQLIEAALDFDENSFEEVLFNATEIFGFEKCIQDVVYLYFEKIGMLWLSNGAMPAHEHFASNIVRKKIISAINALKSREPHEEPYTILFTPEKEYHEIPLLFIYYLMKKNNQPVIYAGANISTTILEDYCSAKKVSCLRFHLITDFTVRNISEYVNSLCKKFPGKQIVMSGPVTKFVRASEKKFFMLKSMEEIVAYTKVDL